MANLRREFIIHFDSGTGLSPKTLREVSLEVLMQKYAHKAIVLSDELIDVDAFEAEIFSDIENIVADDDSSEYAVMLRNLRAELNKEDK